MTGVAFVRKCGEKIIGAVVRILVDVNIIVAPVVKRRN